jgi:predicted nucleic acid-binding protein
MSGNRYVLDTNAIVALLQGNIQLIELLKDADWLGVSVIAKLSFWCFLG